MSTSSKGILALFVLALTLGTGANIWAHQQAWDSQWIANFGILASIYGSFMFVNCLNFELVTKPWVVALNLTNSVFIWSAWIIAIGFWNVIALSALCFLAGMVICVFLLKLSLLKISTSGKESTPVEDPNWDKDITPQDWDEYERQHIDG